MMTLTLAAVYLLPAVPAADPATYPNAKLLVEPAELAKDPDKFTILDVRGKAKYEESNIPHSVLAVIGPWSKAVNEGKADAAFWKKELSSIGVSPKKPVVVVSDDIRDETRAWSLLSYAGVPDVRILNGGWDAYTAAKLPVWGNMTFASAPPHDWKPAPERIATKSDLLALLKSEAKACVIDARSEGEYTGEQQTAKKVGHVPGASHLEWSDLLDPKTKRFKPAPELAKLFADRKIEPEKPCVTYCQSGGRASVVAFGLALMGGKDVRNYYKSWAEWGNAPDTPVEKK